MFERFSEKSLKAVETAKQLAEQLNDESVATGHLIYGLTIDESVCLHHIFKDLNVDPDMFSGYVQSLPREPEESSAGAPFNRHSQTVFDRSREAADQAGADIVEPEHMALAIFSVKAGSCYETLKEFSIDPDYVTMLVMESMGFEVEDAPDWF
ncbi:MAG: Clp protease N-terminal domain-containing protein [Planctomycetota bacterium]|nr:Clp protease N-terminal domain-containing protein [Planctomycetota bacterium]